MKEIQTIIDLIEQNDKLTKMVQDLIQHKHEANLLKANTKVIDYFAEDKQVNKFKKDIRKELELSSAYAENIQIVAAAAGNNPIVINDGLTLNARIKTPLDVAAVKSFYKKHNEDLPIIESTETVFKL
tara:strand:- start:273 stop:656 length:384 start_codon:yes stop_codon:yes gene_type:complete